ncbi:MAG: lysozyme [Alphaproteobacteria bacterium]|nr:lysozyme [Alphaproteobacteria bacterium]MBQ8367937.1 lysozyme [Alphaproteobacteria bacterium]
MKISDKCIKWLKNKENKVQDKTGRHIIYDDSTGRPVNPYAPLPSGATIGYGHLIRRGEDYAQGLTEQQAIDLLAADVSIAERAVQDNITVNLTQNQYDALVALVYNIGVGAFKHSTVLKYINNPEFHSIIYPDLESAWRAWNRTQGKVSNGLVRRRHCEWNMFSRGIY